MQASKIKPGGIYAIKHKDSLARFRVSSVVTTRYQNTGSPHDYKSHVNGRIWDDDGEDLNEVNPNKILGPYEEYVELVEQTEKEKAEKTRIANAERAEALTLWQQLYRVTGLPTPENPTMYKNAIQLSHYGVDIEIHKDAIKPLLAALAKWGEMTDEQKSDQYWTSNTHGGIGGG